LDTEYYGNPLYNTFTISPQTNNSGKIILSIIPIKMYKTYYILFHRIIIYG